MVGKRWITSFECGLFFQRIGVRFPEWKEEEAEKEVEEEEGKEEEEEEQEEEEDEIAEGQPAPF